MTPTHLPPKRVRAIILAQEHAAIYAEAAMVKRDAGYLHLAKKYQSQAADNACFAIFSLLELLAEPKSPLVEWRESLRLNRVQAAAALGCSREALRAWEEGERATPRYIALACSAVAAGLTAVG